jgi:hypothetical protein
MDNKQSYRKKAALDEKLREHLGHQLQLLFAETAELPIPDRFEALLDQLELGETIPCRKGIEMVNANEVDR